MGCGTSRDDLQSQNSRKLDLQIGKDAKALNSETKMLLLGPGESGKSTLFKQMKILAREGGYSEMELSKYKVNIYTNCISQMQLLCEIMVQRGITLSPAMEEHSVFLRSIPGLGENWTLAICDAIMALWADATVQEVYNGSRSELNESTIYFFENLERVRDPQTYTPTTQDVLRARVRSTGIEEAEFKFEELKFRMFDVGGQRSERRKWIHCLAQDHEILTNRGFLSMDEVESRLVQDPGMLVAGFLPRARSLVFERPTRFVKNEAKEQTMIEIESRTSGVSLCVTPGHDMLVVEEAEECKKIKAVDLLEHEAVILSRAAGGVIYGNNDNLAFLWLYGFWLGGNGGVTANEGLVVLEARSELERERIEICLSAADIVFSVQQGTVFVLQSRELAEAFVADLSMVRTVHVTDHGQQKKCKYVAAADEEWLLSVQCVRRQNAKISSETVGSWLMQDSLGAVQSRAFLSGLCACAGALEAEEVAVQTKFERFGIAIEQLAWRAGLGARRDRNGVWLSYQEKVLLRPEMESRSVRYDGSTWCVTMPSGNIVARRGGRSQATAASIVGNCFDGVTVVIFCASLSEYDQVLREDNSTNRMQESLLLFDEIVNSPWFRKTPVVLFLNKIDLFKEKILRVPLTVCFQNYTGKNEPDEAKEFIKQRFLELPADKSKAVYTHYTIAVNTQNVEIVFRVVKETLLREILQDFVV